MADNNSSQSSLDQQGRKAQLQEEIAAVAVRLDAASRDKILKRAAADGWSEPQADWLDKLAKESLFQAVADGVPGNQALEEAYGTARRKLAAGYFDNALKEGKNRYTAFLTVVDLEKQVAERRGDVPPSYPDSVLLVACRAVEAAARDGASTELQIETGYAAIREMSQEVAN